MTGAVLLGSTPPRRLELGDRPIGSGGQATVYAVDGSADMVVKLYHEPTDDLERRLESMLVLAHPDQFLSDDGSGHPVLAWPGALVREVGGTNVIGYTMRRVGAPDHVPLGTLFDAVHRRELFGDISWRFLVHVARNLAGVVGALHERHFVLGDLSHTNVVLDQDGYLCLLDCDSIQFTDPLSGELFASRYFTAEYAAPELQRQDAVARTPQTDDFSLAVLICRLLLVGDHPFMGVRLQAGEDDDADVGRNIQDGCSYLVRPEEVGTPPGTFAIEVLPPDALDLARRAFGPGHLDPDARPTAGDWLSALDRAAAEVGHCPVNRYHAFGGHLPACPWCARVRDGHRDPFPAPATRPAPRPTTPATSAGPSKSSHGVRTAALLVVLVIVVAILAAAIAASA